VRHEREQGEDDQRGDDRFLFNEEHHLSHTFAPWHCIPLATPGGRRFSGLSATSPKPGS
jgi:hypothetical protein